MEDIYYAIDPLITATIIGAGASLLGGIFGSSSNKHASKESMKRQHGYDLENMAIANQYNIDAFNRENEYNKPINQRQRMEEAGLNPNWIDGGMTAIASQDSGLMGSSAQPTNGQGIDFQGAVNSALQAATTEMSRKESAARIDKINTEISDLKSQIRKRDGVDTTNTQAQTEVALADARQKAINSNLTQKTIDNFEKELDARISNYESQNRLNDVMSDVQSKKLPAELDKLISDTAKNNADAAKALNDIVIAKIMAANDSQRVKNDTMRVGIEAEGQKEVARHNRKMESIGVGNLAIQRLLGDANVKYINAQEYSQRLQNTVDYEMWREGIPMKERQAAIRELNEKVRNLQQRYKIDEVKEDYNQWMLRELIRTGDWESIQLQKIFHASPFE